DVLDIDLPWSYAGPVDLQNIAVDSQASASYPCVPYLPRSRERRSRVCGEEANPSFATVSVRIPDHTTSTIATASAPLDGPPVRLHVEIPREDPRNELIDVRNEYLVKLTLKS